MKLKPVLGDHIHTIYSFWVYHENNYKLISPLVDIYPIEEFKDNNSSPEYYLCRSLHLGIHAHGDGRIHIHPFSSIPALRHLSEGINSKLGLFYPMVGITYRIVNNKPSLSFNRNVTFINSTDVDEKSNYTFMNSTSTEEFRFDADNNYQWYLFIWDSYEDFKEQHKPKILTKDLFNIWLYKDKNVFIFGYFPILNYDNIPDIIFNKVYTVISGHIDHLN